MSTWNQTMEQDLVVTIKVYDIEDLCYFLKERIDTQKDLIDCKEYEHADDPQADLLTHQNLLAHYTNELSKLKNPFIKTQGVNAKEHFKVIQTTKRF